MPLMVTSNSRLGPREGGESICKEARELSEETDVPDGDKGMDVSAAGVDSVGWPLVFKCSSRSEKSSERSFCQAIPSGARARRSCQSVCPTTTRIRNLLEGSVMLKLASSRVIPKLYRNAHKSFCIFATTHRLYAPVYIGGFSKLATQGFRTKVLSIPFSR
jgi:hypothetical protein